MLRGEMEVPAASSSDAEVKFSAIIPVYNDEEHLQRAIDSVLSQEPKVTELVIVDDGSTDASGAIAERATVDPRVTVIHQANGGPGAAANAGLALITGTHVILVDSDDWLADGVTSALLPLIQRWNPDVISFAARVVDAEGRPVQGDMHYFKPDIAPPISGVAYYRRVQSNGWVTASSKTYLWRHGYLAAIRLRIPETYIYEDEYFTPIAVVCARSIVSMSDLLYVRMNRPGSLTMRPLSAFNVEQRVASAGLLKDSAPSIAALAGRAAAQLIRDRSRRLARVALVEAERTGHAKDALRMLADRLSGTGPGALGWVGWVMSLRIRLAPPATRSARTGEQS